MDCIFGTNVSAFAAGFTFTLDYHRFFTVVFYGIVGACVVALAAGKAGIGIYLVRAAGKFVAAYHKAGQHEDYQ
jgi:uncharacterized membrane protein YjjP (DUF1212 family)